MMGKWIGHALDDDIDVPLDPEEVTSDPSLPCSSHTLPCASNAASYFSSDYLSAVMHRSTLGRLTRARSSSARCARRST